MQMGDEVDCSTGHSSRADKGSENNSNHKHCHTPVSRHRRSTVLQNTELLHRKVAASTGTTQHRMRSKLRR